MFWTDLPFPCYSQVAIVFLGTNLLHLHLRLTMIGCKLPLGMENGAISDVQITASSQRNDRQAARNARLNFKGQKLAWGWETGTNEFYKWLQVDLGNKTSVTGVATQGSSDEALVTKYKLQHSDDGLTFQNYKAPNNTLAKVYQCIMLAFCSFLVSIRSQVCSVGQDFSLERG